MSVIMRWLDRLFCRLKGHTVWVRRAQGRIFLQCQSCGWESAGLTCEDRVSARQQRIA